MKAQVIHGFDIGDMVTLRSNGHTAEIIELNPFTRLAILYDIDADEQMQMPYAELEVLEVYEEGEWAY